MLSQPRPRMSTPRLAIASSFTADPIRRVLSFWTDTLGWRDTVQFADFGQVFQELLSPASLLRSTPEGACIVLVRLSDWGPSAAERTQAMDSFRDALCAAAEAAPVPYIVAVCPSRTVPDAAAEADTARAWMRGLTACTNVSVVDLSDPTSAALDGMKVFDAKSDAVGQIPYTPELFTVMGTEVLRAIDLTRRPPCKVIVLDCDNTLWDGVCGEDGATGVRIGPHRQRLQDEMIAQVETGRLLALASKNVPDDVWAVFDNHPGMRLRREHIADVEISWDPKPESLRRLASRLNLGLDSFLFLDDNEVECAAVRAGVPDVCTVRLPTDPDAMIQTLRHLWMLDGGAKSSTDQQRTAFYQANAERQSVQSNALTLADFIDSLNLDIVVRAATEDDIPRCAQLTQRTNQFHADPVRRTESDIAALLRRSSARVWTVEVADRFGDYGIVGLMIAQETNTDAREEKSGSLETRKSVGLTWNVDGFMMSCRALGRGVEHRMAQVLGEEALRAGVLMIRIPVLRTPKNEPVRRFLQQIDASLPYERALPSDDAWAEDEVQTLRVFAGALRSVEPDWTAAPPDVQSSSDPKPAAETQSSAAHVQHVRVLERIAIEWNDVAAIDRAIRKTQTRKRPEELGPVVPPNTPVEKTLCQLFESVLQLEAVGRTDDFFAAGGNSLMGAVLLGRIHDALTVELGLPEIFHHPTPSRLARRITAKTVASADIDDLTAELDQLRDLSDDDIQALLAGT